MRKRVERTFDLVQTNFFIQQKKNKKEFSWKKKENK